MLGLEARGFGQFGLRLIEPAEAEQGQAVVEPVFGIGGTEQDGAGEQVGDELVVEISRLGRLTNRIVAERP